MVQHLFPPKLIVGLGNPDDKYARTRHNIGFDVVDALAQSWQLSWKKNKRFQGMVAEGRSSQNHPICLLKPLTYMNRSGQSVKAAVDWYKLPSGSVLVVYDDLDLPLGRARLRLSGSAGGHNGMKSIISHLGSQQYPRLRLGIGKANESGNAASHVLGRFSKQERLLVTNVIELAVEMIEQSLQTGIEKTMSLYNNRIVTV